MREIVEQNRGALLAELSEFLRQRSVSTQPEHAGELRGCADWVAQRLREAGAEVQVMETSGNPVVYAEVGSGDRTLLSYGHYDVQPPEPLEQWESDPFTPEVRNGSLYARGVADDKGDVMARIQALRLFQQEHGPLPFRLKFLIEGEEEVGSPSLEEFVDKNRDLLSADACLWEGAMKDEAGRPLIFCGTKGMAYVELRAQGASHDLHSMYGGIAPNPAWRLVQALRTIKNERGEITIDGFRELMHPPTEEDLAAIEEIPFDEGALKAGWGVEHFDRNLSGEEALRELLLEPTANIAGMEAGYTGPGAKTIVPSQAFVKMDLRLVAGQSPGEVVELLRKHLHDHGFSDIEVADLHGVQTAKTPLDSPIVETAAQSWRAMGHEDAVIYPTIGGSGPTALIATGLGIPTVMTGAVMNAASRIHAPNESVRLEDYYETIDYFADLFRRFAA